MNKEKKNSFLEKIRSKNKESKHHFRYKRVVCSPIRYAGGKSMAVGHIIELFPDNIEKLISPFFGGGSVEIAASKYLDLEVIGYDIFSILVNYWKFQIENPELLCEKLKEFKPNQETYDSVKNRLEDHWDKTTKTFDEWNKGCHRFERYKKLPMFKEIEELKEQIRQVRKDEKIEKIKELREKQKFKMGWAEKEWNRKQILKGIDLASCYYFNFNLSYGPGFLGWAGSIYLNDKKYESMLESIREFRPGNLKVECADFQDVFEKHPNDFFYCDPPYYIGENSKMFKGIYPMRNIPIHHNGFPHEKLLELLSTHNGGFILSYNNCPKVREWYKDYQQVFPSWQYTMGQGEKRIGKNRLKFDQNHIKESHEIIITKLPQK